MRLLARGKVVAVCVGVTDKFMNYRYRWCWKDLKNSKQIAESFVLVGLFRLDPACTPLPAKGKKVFTLSLPWVTGLLMAARNIG
jgi:hypothetical protein